MKIYCQPDGKWTEADRLEILRLLARAGFTVRVGKQKRDDGKPGNIVYVEYFEAERAEAEGEL